MKRSETRPIYVGSVQIGGQNRCVLQSMTNVSTHDVEASVKQINELAKAGCEIVRLAVLNEKVGLTSSANNVNLDEMDALVEVLVESLKK